MGTQVEIADKTSDFVARNGAGFEERIKDKELHNPKFCFLNPNDPYHAYYKFKIKQIIRGKGKEELQKQQEALQEEMQEAPAPPPPFEFITHLPSISKQDLYMEPSL